MVALLHKCVVCDDQGCEYCPKVTRHDLGESYPSELWGFFSNSDLTQLLSDVCVELCRRDESIMVSVR